MRRKMLRFKVIIIAVFFLSVLPVVNAENSLRPEAKVSVNSVIIGDHFPYTLSIIVPRNAVVTFPRPDSGFGSFEVKSFQEKTVKNTYANNAKKVEGVYLLAAYDLGNFTIPTMNVSIQDGTSKRSIVFPPLEVTVREVSANAADKGDIRDVKPPFSIPYPWKLIAAVLAGLAIFSAIIFALIRYFKRKKAVDEPQVVIQLEPYEEAKRKFESINAGSFLIDEMYKEYYSSVSEVIREYLQKQFRMDALEMTTSELLVATKSFKLTWETQDTFRQWLQSADLVKFAKHFPTRIEGEEYLVQAHSILDQFYDVYKSRMETPSHSQGL